MGGIRGFWRLNRAADALADELLLLVNGRDQPGNGFRRRRDVVVGPGKGLGGFEIVAEEGGSGSGPSPARATSAILAVSEWPEAIAASCVIFLRCSKPPRRLIGSFPRRGMSPPVRIGGVSRCLEAKLALFLGF